jgi:hypothetical protein
MYKLISPALEILKPKLESVRVDSSVTRLHYRATVFILASASILITAKQCFGDPIHCIVDGIPQSKSLISVNKQSLTR